MNLRRALAAALALGLAPGVVWSQPGAAVPAQAEVAKQARGTLQWRPNPDRLAQWELRVDAADAVDGQHAFALRVESPVGIVLGDGAPTGADGGLIRIEGLRLLHRDGRATPALFLRPLSSTSLDWQIIDRHGAVWLRIVDAMRSPDRARDGLRLVTADLRAGPALTAWSGRKEPDVLLGNVALRLPLDDSASAVPKSCAAPNWPGTPGYVADVHLVDMNRVDVLRCRRVGVAGTCDGPGNNDGEVVYVPSATLRNRLEADAADIPWYTKFTGNFAPYGNDQHPYLVWSMYRLDDDGRIEQIGRSGLKHAFATANELCLDATCPTNGHILGRGCQDLYNAGSNDLGSALSPRAELIPATGRWGRCGSQFDDTDDNPGDGLPGCDGVQDPGVAFDGYTHRLVLRESTIDPATNPGATYYVDAWYVVRDDVDIFNTMGHRTLQPQHNGSNWIPGPLGPFRTGAVVDRWIEAASLAELPSVSNLATPEGHVRVSARVRQLPDGRYRYDYAIMNFDFSRAISGSRRSICRCPMAPWSTHRNTATAICAATTTGARPRQAIAGAGRRRQGRVSSGARWYSCA
jgi:hypothetical protein